MRTRWLVVAVLLGLGLASEGAARKPTTSAYMDAKALRKTCLERREAVITAHNEFVKFTDNIVITKQIPGLGKSFRKELKSVESAITSLKAICDRLTPVPRPSSSAKETAEPSAAPRNEPQP